ncbi:MAG: DUF2752 domain-containing protein [Eubacterium sp.]|nr:DUF2752 domain-containing protein [Eubacterium sp.]
MKEFRKKHPKKKPEQIRRKKQLQELTIEDCLFLLGTVFAAAALLLAAVWAAAGKPSLARLLPPCLFHQISGYYCPGCGGTRAVRALLHGRLLQSAFFHPFVPYAAAVYLYFMLTQTAERASRGKLPIGLRYRNGIVWIAFCLIAGNFLFKNGLRYYGIAAL